MWYSFSHHFFVNFCIKKAKTNSTVAMISVSMPPTSPITCPAKAGTVNMDAIAKNTNSLLSRFILFPPCVCETSLPAALYRSVYDFFFIA